MTLLSREDWLAKVVDQIGERLTKDGLEPAEDLAALGGRETTTALIVASVATMHSGGHMLDAVTEKISRGRWVEREVDPIAVAAAAISVYRGGHFPLPEWWDAFTVEVSMLEQWADNALRTSSRGEVEEALRDRWLVEDRAIGAIAEGLGEPGPLPMDVARTGSKNSPALTKLIDSKATAELSAKQLALLPESFKNNLQVSEIAKGAGVHEALKIREQALEDDGPEHSEAANLREAIAKSIREHGLALSVLESAALLPVDKDEERLREAVEGTRKRFHFAALGRGITIVNGLSDRLGEQTMAADNLVDQVFSAGARSGLQAWGPSAYMWIALQRHELPPDIEVLALGVPEEEVIPFDLSLSLGRDIDGPTMRYRLGHTDETRRWLAMLVLSKRLTVDIFEIVPEGDLRLVSRSTQKAEDLAGQLKSRTLKVLAGHEPEPFVTGNELENHILGGFGVSENAKSELLMVIGKDAESTDEDVVRTLGILLDAEVARAWALFVNRDPAEADHRVELASRDYADARSWARVDDRQRFSADPLDEHRRLVADFARDGRAVVHYNFGNGHIEGFWSADGGESRGWIAGEEIDLGRLASAASPWLENRQGDVDALLDAARPIATELSQSLAEVDVDELIVIPWSVLHGVPFAAIPLDAGTLGERYGISYAPSLAMLQPLVDAGPSQRHRAEFVAAHGRSLPWADAEVAAASDLYSTSNVTPDGSPRERVIEAMQEGRIVHLATHGRWWRDDPFASSLDLHLDGPFDRYMSAAEIYRDVGLSGAELVLLSACDTGRSPSLRHGIETYSGLDAAFLAKGARAVVSTLWPIDDLAAMLFMTSLHAELAGGHSLPIAFSRSVQLLRTGPLASLADDHPVSVALDAAGIAWRDAAGERAGVLEATRTWSAFKVSGVPWLSQPLPP